MCLLKIFSPSIWLVSRSLTVSFTEFKFLIIIKSGLSTFYFIDCAFSVASKKSLPYPRPSRFSPLLYSKSFIVRSFIVRSMIHFALTFVKDVKSVSVFIFTCGCISVSAPLVEKTVFATLYCLFSFVKGPLTRFMFWDFYSSQLVN